MDTINTQTTPLWGQGADRVAQANAQAQSGAVGGAQSITGTIGGNGTPISTTFDASALGKSSGAITVPQSTPTTPYAGVIAGGQALQDSAEKQAETDVTNANNASGLTDTQNKQSSMLDYVKGLFKQEAGAQEASANKYQPQIDTATKDLTDINTQIADTNVRLRGELDAVKGRGDITQEAQQGLADTVNTKYGRTLADLAIRQSAASGNITALQNNAKYALEQKLAPLQTEISYYKDFLSTNLDNLSKTEQAQAQNIITDKQNILTKTQADETAKTTLLTDVLKGGTKIADDVIQQFLAAPDAATGAAILSKAGVSFAPYQKITDALGNESLVQPGRGGSPGSPTPTGNISSGSSNGTTGTPGAGAVGTGTNKLSFAQYGLLANTDFNPTNQVDSLAQKYLDLYIKNGAVPVASSLGRNVKLGAMAQIDSRARDLYFKATGNPLPNPDIIKGYQNLVNDNNKLANNLKIQEQTVSANVDFSLANMKNNGLDSAGFKPLSNVINSVENMFNDPATGQMLAQNTTIKNELGSLLAVKNASGTTVYDKLSSAGIITSGDSPAQIKAKVTALIVEAGNFADSLKTANADIYKQIDPMMQDANNPLRQKYQDSATVDSALKKLGVSYQDAVSTPIPDGEILVITKDGKIGSIPPSEFDPAQYIKL